MKFAIQHKNLVRRSAFTYCENRCPSRMDFGKQSYGGPFTTEEVEDFKVLFNILKVLLSLSPTFFLDLCATRIISDHPMTLPADYFVNDTYKNRFLGIWCTITFVNSYLLPISNKMFYFEIFSQHVQKNGVKSIAFVCITLYLMNYVIGGSQ